MRHRWIAVRSVPEEIGYLPDGLEPEHLAERSWLLMRTRGKRVRMPMTCKQSPEENLRSAFCSLTEPDEMAKFADLHGALGAGCGAGVPEFVLERRQVFVGESLDRYVIFGEPLHLWEREVRLLSAVGRVESAVRAAARRSAIPNRIAEKLLEEMNELDARFVKESERERLTRIAARQHSTQGPERMKLSREVEEMGLRVLVRLIEPAHRARVSSPELKILSADRRRCELISTPPVFQNLGEDCFSRTLREHLWREVFQKLDLSGVGRLCAWCREFFRTRGPGAKNAQSSHCGDSCRKAASRDREAEVR